MKNFAAAIFLILLSQQGQSTGGQKIEEKGNVQGFITRSGTPDPVAGAQVRLTDPAILQRLVDLLSAQGVTVAVPATGVADDLYISRLHAVIAAE